MNTILCDFISAMNTCCKNYKEKIDTLAKEYFAEKARYDAEISRERSSGDFSEQYFQNKSFVPSKNYTTQIEKTKRSPLITYEALAGKVKDMLEEYFNEPLNPDFSNKINTFSNAGLILSDSEMKSLEKTAQNYYEKRLFDQFASSRKDSEGKANPFIYSSRIANLEEVKREYDNLYYAGKRLFDFYAGKVVINEASNHNLEKAEYAVLFDVLPQTENMKKYGFQSRDAVTADSFVTQRYADSFIDYLVRNGIAEIRYEKPLSEDERKIIDALIDPKYSLLIPETVRNLSKENMMMRDMLKRDERYSEFVPVLT